MLGLRGVPATDGGVEHHVEQLGRRLAARGHRVTVFCRTNYVEPRLTEFEGMRLRHLPTVGTKHLDAIVHTALATGGALRGHDILHYHSVGPALLTPVPRLLSTAAVVQTVHGLDGERLKWGPVARRVLRGGEWLSARVPHATITVSASLADHFLHAHGRATTVIPNGARPMLPRRLGELGRRLGLTGGDYLLDVGRLVPEKQPDLLIRAFRDVPSAQKLVLVGGSSHTDAYVARLRRLAGGDGRVVLAGPVFGEDLEALYANAALCVAPSRTEGSPLAVLEAVGAGAAVVASDIAAHREVLGPPGPGRRYFRAGDQASLAGALELALAEATGAGPPAGEGSDPATRLPSWDRAAELTEQVYVRALCARRGG